MEKQEIIQLAAQCMFLGAVVFGGVAMNRYISQKAAAERCKYNHVIATGTIDRVVDGEEHKERFFLRMESNGKAITLPMKVEYLADSANAKTYLGQLRTYAQHQTLVGVNYCTDTHVQSVTPR